MDISQLEYFQAVARTENMTKAAEMMHISQPALSRAISKLEEDLDVSLFERDGNRIRLGPCGVVFLRHVDQILKELDETREELHRMTGCDYGSIVLSSFTAGLINDPVRDFLKAHPNITFRHMIQSPDEIRQSLEHGEIDIALSILPVISPNINWIPVMNDEFIALVSVEHPLAQKREINLSELASEPICLNSAEYGMHEIFEGFCAQAGFEPKIIYEGSDGEICMSFLRSNSCVFLMPASIHVWKVLADREAEAFRMKPSMVALHISNPSCQWQYGIATSKNHAMTDATKSFYRTLLDFFKNYRETWTETAIKQFLNEESEHVTSE